LPIGWSPSPSLGCRSGSLLCRTQLFLCSSWSNTLFGIV
jgi:hypothetical protein